MKLFLATCATGATPKLVGSFSLLPIIWQGFLSQLQVQIVQVSDAAGAVKQPTDGVVEPLKAASCDGISTVVDEFLLVAQEALGETSQDGNAGLCRPCDPSAQIGTGTRRVLVGPQPFERFFEHIDLVEIGIEFEQVLEPTALFWGTVVGVAVLSFSAAEVIAYYIFGGYPRFFKPSILNWKAQWHNWFVLVLHICISLYLYRRSVFGSNLALSADR